MARYVAFLRAINVGGRVVKMDTLKKAFIRLGLTDVEAFIASGNIIFSSPVKDTAKLERRIEAQLEKDLGYEVATFVRTTDDVIAIAGYRAFAPTKVETAVALNVGFLGAPMSAEAKAALDKLVTDADLLHVNEREWYWLSQSRQSESVISNAAIERVLNARSTLRGMNTIIRLAGRLQPQAGKAAPPRRAASARRKKRKR
jgi:uncharacterized protein (DUF1697 family)